MSDHGGSTRGESGFINFWIDLDQSRLVDEFVTTRLYHVSSVTRYLEPTPRFVSNFRFKIAALAEDTTEPLLLFALYLHVNEYYCACCSLPILTCPDPGFLFYTVFFQRCNLTTSKFEAKQTHHERSSKKSHIVTGTVGEGAQLSLTSLGTSSATHRDCRLSEKKWCNSIIFFSLPVPDSYAAKKFAHHRSNFDFDSC